MLRKFSTSVLRLLLSFESDRADASTCAEAEPVALAAKNPAPTEAEVRHGLEGNICRCTGYQNIVASVLAGAAAMNAPAIGE